MSKPTKAEHRKRINQVAAMLATGSPRADICQYAIDKWSVSTPTVDRYIATATAEMNEAAEATREADAAHARAVYHLIMREQIGARDYRGAAATADKLCRLLGTNAPERKELSGPDGGPIEYVDTAKEVRDRLAGRIAGIAAAQRAAGDASESD